MNDSTEAPDIYDAEPPPESVAVAGPQILADDGPSASEEKAREIAFNTGPPTWNGRQLRAWTSGRESYWLEMRGALGAQHLSDCVLSSYAFLPDAFRILFLCHASEEEIARLRVDVASFQAAVEAWADSHVAMDRHDEAVTLAMKIYNAAHKNHPEAAPSETPTHGDDLGN